MDYPWAVPGAKVVCVDARHPFGFIGLVEGEKYTIAEVGHSFGIDRYGDLAATPSVRLVGVVKQWPRTDDFFDVTRFRPLITQSDDLAKFTHLLNTQKIEERA